MIKQVWVFGIRKKNLTDRDQQYLGIVLRQVYQMENENKAGQNFYNSNLDTSENNSYQPSKMMSILQNYLKSYQNSSQSSSVLDSRLVESLSEIAETIAISIQRGNQAFMLLQSQEPELHISLIDQQQFLQEKVGNLLDLCNITTPEEYQLYLEQQYNKLVKISLTHFKNLQKQKALNQQLILKLKKREQSNDFIGINEERDHSVSGNNSDLRSIDFSKLELKCQLYHQKYMEYKVLHGKYIKIMNRTNEISNRSNS